MMVQYDIVSTYNGGYSWFCWWIGGVQIDCVGQAGLYDASEGCAKYGILLQSKYSYPLEHEKYLNGLWVSANGNAYNRAMNVY